MRSYDDQPSGTIAELRRLRRAASSPERRLLRALKESFPQLKWRHHSPVGPFRPDILCFREKLIVEVDGDTHAATEKRDADRTAFLNRQGHRVIRFANTEVTQNLDGVIAAISLSLRKREGGPQGRKGEGDMRSSPSPSHAAAQRGSLPLPMGEEDQSGAPPSSSSNVTATSALADRRTWSPSTPATSPAGM